jgi:S-adenosylhomocysteine hydrolase
MSIADRALEACISVHAVDGLAVSKRRKRRQAFTISTGAGRCRYSHAEGRLMALVMGGANDMARMRYSFANKVGGLVFRQVMVHSSARI